MHKVPDLSDAVRVPLQDCEDYAPGNAPELAKGVRAACACKTILSFARNLAPDGVRKSDLLQPVIHTKPALKEAPSATPHTVHFLEAKVDVSLS